MDILNITIEGFLKEIQVINSVPLPGGITQTIVENISKVEKAFKTFVRAQKMLLEATALKNEKGFVFADETDGRKSYTYNNEAEKKRVIKEIENLNLTVVKLEFIKGDKKVFSTIKEITPEQMRVCLILTGNLEDEDSKKVEVKTKKK